MNGLFSIIVTLLYIVIVAYLVIKEYNSVFVFLSSGILVLLISTIITGATILGEETSGSGIIDVFVYATNAFKSNVSGVGLTLMMVTGYAMYMSHIGASTKLAYIATKPLSKIKSPYVVLSLLFVIGTMLKLVITSHAGLSMLLMAISFPILTSLGISKLSAATAIIMSGFVDWGPNDSSAIFAGENVVGMPMMEYFLTYQAKTAIILIIIAAIFLPIYLWKIDQKSISKNSDDIKTEKVENVDCPIIYAILPVIPLLLITIFSFIPTIELDVVTANLIGLIFVFTLELLVKKDRKRVTNDFNVVLKAMGNSFARVVSILIGAALFAEAIQLLGGITIISNALASIRSAPIITMALMSLITFLAGMLLGSGNASWYAFGPLVPDVTMQMGISTATIALPMQLSSGIGRSMSPVAGAMISVAGMAEVELTDLIKRCSIPSMVMFVCNLVVSYLVV
ncbi:C4-dicarboxylate transporter DcuC [Miniphocaeibacter halophilus]|uniref:C4-dicarboxylate transporter DcuC n=1 Tax=Miniphocaeibacter halophilus TaxID=2931922 RepID=A0AC61MUT7_9FIRM|nr:C4-dicarboxylate transporter DcuC [Miniphocaeibacter halophilus]QQK07781.1 C4-dicarboxylate transporter DcuC [Miniphocaeibacter halophilus]